MPASSPPSTAVDLLRAIGRGDEVALGAFFDDFAPVVLELAQRLTGDVGRAAVVAEQVFLDVWAQAGRFDPAGSAGAWVFALTRQRASAGCRS